MIEDNVTKKGNENEPTSRYPPPSDANRVGGAKTASGVRLQGLRDA